MERTVHVTAGASLQSGDGKGTGMNHLNTRNRRQRKSECCNAPMIGGVQCETCGSDGKLHVEQPDRLVGTAEEAEL